MASDWRTWVSDRFGLGLVKEATLDRRVAKVPWYYGDGATLLLLLGVQVVTGIVMALTYSPTPDGAYASVRYITEEQTLGWFVRSLHYWSAGLMVVMLFVHLFRQILVAGYKFPREGTWLIGVLLFFAVLIMSFTGYVLRWDERAVHALRVALHMFSNIPLIGEELVRFVQGGEEPGSTTLTRFYAVHVLVVPLLLLIFAGWHLYLVMLHGVTSRGERKQPVHSDDQQRALYQKQAQSDEEGEKFYPFMVAKSGTVAATVFFIVLALAVLAGPARLLPEANLVGPAYPVEEWWFWWYSALIALLPPQIAPAFTVVFPILVFLLLVSLPFIDRGPYRGIRKRPAAVVIVLVLAIALLALSALRMQSPWTAWPSDEPPPVPEGVSISPEAELGRHLFAQFGCNTCHAVSGVGPQVGPDFATVGPRSREEIHEYTLRPPEGIPMPAYEQHLEEGWMTEEELDRIVEFVLVAQTFPGE